MHELPRSAHLHECLGRAGQDLRRLARVVARRHGLIRTLPDTDEALWLEQLLEDELGIADRPVRGEHR